MDAYVEGEEDTVFNVEIQKSNDTNHVKRARYNAACITVKRSEPGDRFDDIHKCTWKRWEQNITPDETL